MTVGWSEPGEAFTCKRCGQPDVFNKAMHRCRSALVRTTTHVTKPGRPTVEPPKLPPKSIPNAPKGRVCKWCEATDKEAEFRGMEMECLVCYSTRHRPGGKCGTCGGPRARWGCPRCHRPKGMLRVILLDAGSDRERVIYRAPGQLTPAVVLGKQVRCRDFIEFRCVRDLVVTLPTPQWVSTRL